MRRAGGVEHDTAGAGQRNRRGQQFALQLGQRGNIGRSAPPAGLRAPAQRAQTGARRVDEHPVEYPAQDRSRGRLPAAHRPEVRGCSAPPGPRGGGDGSTAVTEPPCWAAMAGQQRRLAARARAQVQPAAAVVAHQRRQGQRRGRPAGCPRPAPVPGRRAPPPAGRGRRRAGTPRRANSGRRCRPPPRPAARRSAHRAGRPGAPAAARRRRPVRVEFAGVGAQRVGEGLGDPARVGVHERGMSDRVSAAGGASSATQDASSRPEMVRSTPLTKPARAESNSSPACSTVVDTAACCGDVGAQQLIGAEPEQVEQHGVDLAPTGARPPRRSPRPAVRDAAGCHRSARWRTPRRGR